jgi:hypothetical protein
MTIEIVFGVIVLALLAAIVAAFLEGGPLMIERMYVDAGPQVSTWEPITEEEFIRRTEWAGHYKPGTALEAIKGLGKIRTPWAFFRWRALER